MLKTVTSAAANKLLKSLEEEKSYWRTIEQNSCVYTAAVNENPVVPEYDYASVAEKITMIDKKIRKIKHALNRHNTVSMVHFGNESMYVDEILIHMAQLSKRKSVLDEMRRRLPKRRLQSVSFRSNIVEYEYTNYDIDLVKKEFDAVSDRLIQLQMALDKFNQTETFEIDV